MFISSFCSKSFIWVWFPSHPVGSPYIFLHLTLYSLHFFIHFVTELNHFCEHPDYQCFEFCIWLAISSSLSCIFFWSFDLFFHLGHNFFVSVHLFHSKGQSLRYSSGEGKHPHHCVVAVYVGEGSEREQCCLVSSRLASSHFLHYLQANWALLVLIPRWVGLCTF